MRKSSDLLIHYMLPKKNSSLKFFNIHKFTQNILMLIDLGAGAAFPLSVWHYCKVFVISHPQNLAEFNRS